MSMEDYIVKRIEMIQRDLDDLKTLIRGKGKNVSLEGLWEGANITDEEIEEAKRSLFRKGIEFGQSS